MPSGPVRKPEMLRPGRNGSPATSPPWKASSRLPTGSANTMRSLTRRSSASARLPRATATPAAFEPRRERVERRRVGGFPAEEIGAAFGVGVDDHALLAVVHAQRERRCCSCRRAACRGNGSHSPPSRRDCPSGCRYSRAPATPCWRPPPDAVASASGSVSRRRAARNAAAIATTKAATGQGAGRVASVTPYRGKRNGAATSAGGTSATRLRRLDVRQLFGHLDQQLARLAALDLVERLHDPHRAGGLQESEHAFVAAGRLLRAAVRPRCRRRRRTRSALPALPRCAAAGLRRCGSRPSRISAPAGTSRRSDPASSVCDSRHSSRRERTRRPTSASRMIGASRSHVFVESLWPVSCFLLLPCVDC